MMKIKILNNKFTLAAVETMCLYATFSVLSLCGCRMIYSYEREPLNLYPQNNTADFSQELPLRRGMTLPEVEKIVLDTTADIDFHGSGVFTIDYKSLCLKIYFVADKVADWTYYRARSV